MGEVGGGLNVGGVDVHHGFTERKVGDIYHGEP